MGKRHAPKSRMNEFIDPVFRLYNFTLELSSRNHKKRYYNENLQELQLDYSQQTYHITPS